MNGKSRKIILDIAIVILIIALVVIADIVISKFRSNPAEEKIAKNGQSAATDSLALLPIAANEKVFLPILNFHHIDKAPANLSAVDKSFYIEPAKFEDILNKLIAADYRPVFTSEIVNGLKDLKIPDEKIIAITFDDGNEDFYTQAWPILQKLKIISNIYIMTGVKGKSWLTPEQIIELDKSGLVEIGSHTVYHQKLTKITSTEALKELINSKKSLEDLLGKEINIICYPFGLYNQQIEDLAQKAGYEAGLTFDQDAWQNPDNLFELKRISVYPGLDVMKFLEKLRDNK
ncbi:MAG: polysaccharide deacetylase family protein [Patescibacteria group bacterium]